VKQRRLILIVAVVALLVVGGAYAAWSSRTTISVNASAGEMDVEISSVTVGTVSEYVQFGKDSISVSEDKKSATVSIENLYPGAEANATIVITNIGTIPVMLSSASQVRELAVNTKTNTNLSETAADILIVKYTATADTKNGLVKASDSSSQTTASLFQNTNIVIEAGKTIQIDMQITLDKNALDETENTLFTFQFVPMFVQPTGESATGESADGVPATEVSASESPTAQETAEPANTLSDFEKSFSETSSYIIEKIQDHYVQTGKYGRNWGTYAYSDIGLSASDLASPIDHVVYSPGGSTLSIRPEVGYTFSVQSVSGTDMKLPERYKWNLVYSNLTQKWYYHTINDSNEININTLSISRDK